jgi:hypothetical protein
VAQGLIRTLEFHPSQDLTKLSNTVVSEKDKLEEFSVFSVYNIYLLLKVMRSHSTSLLGRVKRKF